MYAPRAVARFNRRVTNPVQRRWAGTLPGFGIVEHAGRRSGTAYRTPVNAFPASGGFAVLAVYGPDSDWIRNVLAAGGGTLVHRRRHYTISGPRLLAGREARALLPRPVRLVSRLLRNDDVLFLAASPR